MEKIQLLVVVTLSMVLAPLQASLEDVKTTFSSKMSECEVALFKSTQVNQGLRSFFKQAQKDSRRSKTDEISIEKLTEGFNKSISEVVQVLSFGIEVCAQARRALRAVEPSAEKLIFEQLVLSKGIELQEKLVGYVDIPEFDDAVKTVIPSKAVDRFIERLRSSKKQKTEEIEAAARARRVQALELYKVAHSVL